MHIPAFAPSLGLNGRLTRSWLALNGLTRSGLALSGLIRSGVTLAQAVANFSTFFEALCAVTSIDLFFTFPVEVGARNVDVDTSENGS